MGKFSIMDILNDNSKTNKNSDDKFETKMINVFDIVESEFNFFSTAEIDDLADSIEMFGVMQNLIVKELGNGKYKLIAGHRRRRGCIKLVNEGKKQFKFVPCKIESSEDDIREKLLLIYTNSTTRELSDYEKVEQAKQLKELLMEYKKDHNLPGRVRDLVADTLKISATQVARMDSISHNLTDNLKNEFKENKINISTAYEMSGLKKEKQEEIFRTAKERETISDTFNISLKEIRELKQPIKGEIAAPEKQEPETEKVEPEYLDKLVAGWSKRNMTVELYELAKSTGQEDAEVFLRYFREKYIHEGFAPAYNIPGYEIAYKSDKNGIYFDDIYKTEYPWDMLIDEVCYAAENDVIEAKPINLHENEDGLKRLREIRREVKLEKSVKQSGHECNSLAHRQIVNEQPEDIIETSETVIEEQENVIPEKECENCNYNDMDPDKYRADHPDTKEFPCNNCDDKLNHWVPKIVKPDQTDIFPCDTCAREVQGCCDYPNTNDDYCVKGDKWQPKESDPVETVEADIIPTDGLRFDCYSDEEGWHEEIIQYDDTANEPGSLGELLLAKEILRNKQDTLIDWIEATKNNLTSDDTRNINKLKIEVGALAAYICDIDNIVNPIPEPVQLELPILKNNDQRKEWIDNYTSWPVWIDIPQTGEKYYRYDLSSNVAIVVKVSWKHSWERYKETKDFEYSAEQYYLLGIKSEWHNGKSTYEEDDNRTFYECSTNKSAIVEYLKEIQKTR